jgi:trehalose transport system substrate-binding protein
MKGVRRTLVVLAVLAVLSVPSCGGGADDVEDGNRLAGTAITFSISVSEEERAAIQELLSRFEDRSKTTVNLERLSRFRRQPGARVNLTSVDSDKLRAKLQAERGAPTIHLFAQDNLALKPLVDEELVEDLSSVHIPPAVLPSMVPPRFAGRQMFLPFRPNVRLAYLDKERSQGAGVRAPGTVEELMLAAQQFKAVSGRPEVTLSLAEGDPAAVTISEWILSFGGDPLVLNDEGSVSAFEFLQRLWKEGLIARESLFARYDTEVQYLREGRTSLAQNWSFTSAVLAKQGMLQRFEVFAGWAGPKRAVHVIGGDVLGIPKGVQGKQREAALALARFLMSREAQEYLVTQNAWPSIRTDAYREVPQEQKQTFAAIQEALRNGWFRPSVSHWPNVTNQMNDAVSRILLQLEPVRAVLDELHAKIELAATRQHP